MIIVEKDYLASKLNRTKTPKPNEKLSMQIDNATGIKRPDQLCEVTAGENKGLWMSTVKNKKTFFTDKMQRKMLQYEK